MFTVPYVSKGPEEGIRSPRTRVPRGWELPGRCWEPDPDLSKSSKCPQQSQFCEPDPQPHILKHKSTSLSAKFLLCFIPCTSKVLLSNSARENNYKGIAWGRELQMEWEQQASSSVSVSSCRHTASMPLLQHHAQFIHLQEAFAFHLGQG